MKKPLYFVTQISCQIICKYKLHISDKKTFLCKQLNINNILTKVNLFLSLDTC